MAVVHSSATIRPTKAELLEATLGGPVEVLGAYRFDDPDGEVGIEGFLVRADSRVRHVLFTYRGAILAVEGARLVSTMEHSVLGPRWVYDGTTDPVAVECFRRALRGEQAEAELEVWVDGSPAGSREPGVRLRATSGEAGDTGDEPSSGTVRILRDPADGVPGPALVASWDDGEAVIAVLEG
ncbi:MAG TPA: hypothetical protein VNS46_10480 [Nocardioides sp.]|nr:hypothetical protein [Nocardioides sp.]